MPGGHLWLDCDCVQAANALALLIDGTAPEKLSTLLTEDGKPLPALMFAALKEHEDKARGETG